VIIEESPDIYKRKERGKKKDKRKKKKKEEKKKKREKTKKNQAGRKEKPEIERHSLGSPSLRCVRASSHLHLGIYNSLKYLWEELDEEARRPCVSSTQRASTQLSGTSKRQVLRGHVLKNKCEAPH